MVQERERPKLHLKNGSVADVEDALAALGYLRYLLDEEPKLFAALLALAQGKPEDADPEQVKALPKGEFFGTDDKLRPIVAAVLLSSFRQTREGSVLINPFRFESETDKLMVERLAKEAAIADRAFGQWLMRFFRGRSIE
jgi:hypothetical protein